MVKRYFSSKYIVCVSSFFLFFMIRILFSNLVSVFLLDQGYSALDVSMVSAIALVASFFTVPIIGKHIDVYGIKKVCTLLLIISSMAGFLFSFAKNLLLSGLLYCVVIICINVLHPIVERQATQTAYSYGSVRIWGTLGNAIGTQLGGILYQYISPQSVYVTFAFASVITCIILGNASKDSKPSSIDYATRKTMASLKLPPRFFLYIAIVFFFYAALDSKTLYLTAFLKASGFSVNGASTMLFFASLFEIPVVLFGGNLIDKLSSKSLMLTCLALLASQLSIYAYFSTYSIIIIIETLLTNAVISMLYIMVNMKVINEIIDTNHQLTALTITTGVRSLAAVIGQTVGGRLIDLYSYHHFFMLLSCFILIAILLTLIIRLPNHNNSLHLYT